MKSPAYYLNDEPVSRGAFYEVACDPSRSVVVEACAGAGKTWMLVSRILRALLDGAQPQHILAITFTRKAAGEMRQRLNTWLEEFSASRCDDDKRVLQLQMRGFTEAQARQVAPQLAAMHAQLIEADRPVQILTFHRWFFQLLRVAPMDLLAELGLSPDLNLVEEWGDHEREVYRRFHHAVMRDEALHADFEALVQRHGRSQLRKWLDAAWDKRVELALADAAGRLEPSVQPAAALWSQYQGLSRPAERLQSPVVNEALLDLAKALGQHRSAAAKKHGAQLIQALELADLEARFQAVRSALYTEKGTVRKAVEVDALPLAQAHIDDIAAARDQQLAHEEHLSMVRLSRCLLQELRHYKRAHGLADMADLELCALRLLSDSRLSGWVQERLDTQIRHLLIDEFQDTSPLQWHALHAWLSAYAGAGGGASGQRPPSVFIVGDPKQSIYRFRRAEPKVFEAAQSFVREALGGVMLSCDHTHRNAPGVLSVVNAVFQDAQQQREFGGFRPHTTERLLVDSGRGTPDAQSGDGLRPPVAVWHLPMVIADADADADVGAVDPDGWRDSLTTPRTEPETSSRQLEARQVAQVLSQLVRMEGVLPRDIKILARKRHVLHAVQHELQQLNLPLAAVGNYRLAEHIVVKDLLALLDALVSPQHRLSLAHALRSPIFAASDEDLLCLAAAAQAAPFAGDWWRALMALDSPSQALSRAASLLSRWRVASQQLPPHDLLDRIVFEGQLRERVVTTFPPSSAPQALMAIDAMLEQALTIDGARYATVYRFVRALRRRAIDVALPVPNNALELLTVHGAKGLEAPWVFLMDTDPLPPVAETVTLLVDWPVHERAPLSCGFVYATRRCPSSLQGLLDRELQARDREELNGLYVALTRAGSNLVLSATAGQSKKASDGARRRSWWQRVQPLSASWADRPAPLLAASAELSHDLNPTELWELPALSPGHAAGASLEPEPDFKPDLETGQRTGGALGEAVHLCLQWASAQADATRGASDESSVVDIAAWAQAAADQHSVDADLVLHRANAIWSSPHTEVFFRGGALRWSGNEVPVAVGGRTRRIDRLVALDEEGQTVWWVLDYKLHPSPHEVPAYRAQLEAYQLAVEALQPCDTVRCAFISGDGLLIELK